MHLGILAPYTWSEATRMALRLARLAETVCDSVEFYPLGKPKLGVDPYWDSRRLKPSKTKLAAWSATRHQLVWFEHAPQLLASAAGGPRHLLVASGHRLTEAVLAQLPRCYQTLVSPCSKLGSVLSARCAAVQPISADFVQEIPWFSEDVERCGATLSVVPLRRCWVPLSSYTIGKIGSLLIYCFAQCLLDNKQLTLDVASDSTWPRALAGRLKELSSQYPGRFLHRVGVSRLEEQAGLAQCNAVLDLSLRRDSPYMPSQAIAMGRPVIAFDLPPSTDVLNHEVNAWLLRCEIQTNHLGVPTAIPNLQRIQEGITQLCQSELSHKLKQNMPWRDDARQQAVLRFDREWKELWGYSQS